MVQLSSRIQDEQIQKSLQRKLKRKIKRRRRNWRWIWSIIIILLIGAFVYFGYRFELYGESKVDNLLAAGQAAEEQMYYQEALLNYDQALILKGVAQEKASLAAFSAARIFSSTGQHVQAQEYLSQAIELQPENLELRVALAGSFIKSRDLDQAEQTIQEAEEIDAQAPGLLLVKAELALARQQVAEAEKLVERVLDQDEQNQRAQFLQAVFIMHDEPEAARQIFEELVQTSRSPTKIAKIEELIDLADQIESKIGNPAFEFVLVGASLFEHGDFDLALTEVLAAIEQDSDYRDAWIYRAEAELATDQFDAAQISLAKAVELDPTHGYTRFIEGSLAVEGEDFTQAVEKFQLAIQQGFAEDQVVVALAKAFVLANRTPDAITVLQDAIAENSTELFYQELFWIYYNEDDFSEAEDIAEEYVEERKTATAHGLLALALFALEKEKRAGNEAEDALEIDQSNPAGLLVQGLIENDEGLIRHAIDGDNDGRVSQLAKDYLN